MFYDVAISKDDKGYWQWDSFVAGAPGEASVQVNNTVNKATVAPKSNYETPEERAARQVYIVKQSSVTAALKFFELTKEKPTKQNMFDFAQEIADWVFATHQGKKQELFDLPNDIDVE